MTLRPSGGVIPVLDLVGLLPQENAGTPLSGLAGTLAGIAKPGAKIIDTTNGVEYVNEGTSACPYWSPTSFEQLGLFGVHSDFRDRVGLVITDTTGENYIAGSGVRIFGQGLAEVDSGLVIQTSGEGGQVMYMTTTNEDAHTVALGMAAGCMQPDQHGALIIDVDIAVVSALTTKAVFVGFLGTAAAALDPAVTGATTVATLVQDDMAGVWYDAGLTDADRWFAVHNKSDEAATQNLATDGDTSIDVEAAGTYQRVRVQIDEDGGMTVFINKAQVYTNTACLDVDEECSPVVYIESQTTATSSLAIRSIACFAGRAA